MTAKKEKKTERYIVKTVLSFTRDIPTPHQVIDTQTSQIVDEYHSKRAALMHARELNQEEL